MPHGRSYQNMFTIYVYIYTERERDSRCPFSFHVSHPAMFGTHHTYHKPPDIPILPPCFMPKSPWIPVSLQFLMPESPWIPHVASIPMFHHVSCLNQTIKLPQKRHGITKTPHTQPWRRPGIPEDVRATPPSSSPRCPRIATNSPSSQKTSPWWSSPIASSRGWWFQGITIFWGSINRIQ